MKKYTVGFIFTPGFEQVLLVHKNRPEWQKGLLNGVGGKIEEGEESVDCMVREVREETKLETQAKDWHFYAKIQNAERFVDFYACIYSGNITDAQTTTDEPVAWFPVSALPENVIFNLRWLIPLAIDSVRSGKIVAMVQDEGGEVEP
jgi:8-oxo-dGTP diphosphatase